MSVLRSYPSPSHAYQAHQYSPGLAAPRYHFEDITDTAYFDAPQPAPSLLKRAFKGALKLSGVLLGVLAFKRYCPVWADQIGNLIPEFIQKPFKAMSDNWLGRGFTQATECLLNQSEAIFATLKGFLGGFFNKGG